MAILAEYPQPGLLAEQSLKERDNIVPPAQAPRWFNVVYGAVSHLPPAPANFTLHFPLLLLSRSLVWPPIVLEFPCDWRPLSGHESQVGSDEPPELGLCPLVTGARSRYFFLWHDYFR